MKTILFSPVNQTRTYKNCFLLGNSCLLILRLHPFISLLQWSSQIPSVSLPHDCHFICLFYTMENNTHLNEEGTSCIKTSLWYIVRLYLNKKEYSWRFYVHYWWCNDCMTHSSPAMDPQN